MDIVIITFVTIAIRALGRSKEISASNAVFPPAGRKVYRIVSLFCPLTLGISDNLTQRHGL